MTATAKDGRPTRKISVLRFALAGAIASGLFFALCWLGAFLPIGPATHMYLQLFTRAQITTGLALVQGLCWSVIFGLVAGALIAMTYDLVAALDVR